MRADQGGVLLIDWENLAASIVGRERRVTRVVIDKIWEFGQRFSETGLQRKDIAAAAFPESIQRAVTEHLIKIEPVRGEKEQADIALTVLAMDYLHAGFRTFILVTGDQDFVPLIARLHAEQCRIAVIFGDPRRMSASLAAILDSPGIEKHDIDDIVGGLQTPPMMNPERKSKSVLALLELARRGHYIGGPERNGRLELLRSWGVSGIEDDSDYRNLVNTLCMQVDQRRAAVRVDGRWQAAARRRTRLNQTNDSLACILEFDHVLRRIQRRREGTPIQDLRTGPFKLDDGSRLSTALDAIKSIQLARQTGDGTYALTDPDEIGYLEPLWRVYAATSAESFRLGKTTIPWHSLESMLVRQGVGPGKNNRDRAKIGQAVDFARSFGTIDTVVQDDRRAAEPNHGDRINQMFAHAYVSLKRILTINTPSHEHRLLSAMAEYDSGATRPVFGWDDRDRSRLLRILVQTKLCRRQGDHIVLLGHRWLESLK